MGKPVEVHTRKGRVNKEKWKKNVDKINRYSPEGPPKIPNCRHNDEKFKCATLHPSDIKKFHKAFYKTANKTVQDHFILKYVKSSPVIRHRNKVNSPTKRTSEYFIKNRDGYLVPVCVKAFTGILRINRFRINRITKMDFDQSFVEERRGGFRFADKFKVQTESIVSFLNKLQCSEIHYCRDKTEKKYLGPELSINAVYKMYCESFPTPEDVPAKSSYFRHIFNTRFNFAFGTPATDQCSTCLQYQERIKIEQDEDEKQQLKVALAIHKKRAKTFYEFLSPPQPKDDGSELIDDTLILSFDCEKNLQLLRVPDSAAYYKRNVYFYNFSIVRGHSKSELNPNNVTAFCWTENEYPKNANAIASCIIHELNAIDLTHYNHIRLVSDGCTGQNKNSILISALLKWLSESAPHHVVDLEMIFPTTGHSYLPANRVFAQIEKKVRKRTTIINPEDYYEIIKEFATIKKVGTDVKVLRIKKAVESVIKPCASWHFSISKSKRIILRRNQQNPEIIEMKGELFYKHDTEEFSRSYCKRGKNLKNIHYEEVPEGNTISAEKKKDLLELLEKHYGPNWRALPTLSFFVYLLDIETIEYEGEWENPDDVVEPACVCTEEMPDLIV